MLGGSYYAYRFVTSEQFKARVMNEVTTIETDIAAQITESKTPTKTSGVPW